MKRKKVVSLASLAIMATMVTWQAFANPATRISSWHESTITLPRNGWWYTIDRKATESYQETKVTKPAYNVVSNIAGDNDDEKLSTNKTHRSGNTDIKTHQTNVKGKKVRGAFRSSIVNQFTNQVKLAWRL